MTSLATLPALAAATTDDPEPPSRPSHPPLIHRLQGGQQMTADLFTALDNKGFELVAGVVQEKAMSAYSDAFQTWLIMFLAMAADEFGGNIAGPEGGLRCFADPNTIRKPDFAWTAPDRLQPLPEYGWTEVAPTFAIEVLSPRNTVKEIAEKVALFLAAGVEMVWVIDPLKLVATVHTKKGSAEYDASTPLPSPLPTLQLTLQQVADKANRGATRAVPPADPPANTAGTTDPERSEESA